MNRWIKTHILAAAVAAVPLLMTGSAGAQYRINEDGRALDASNRVGSGGVNPNDSHKRVGEQVAGNDIVNGTVTGGKQFRGHVPYQDPRGFRGQTAGVNIDDFQRSSSGVDSRFAQEVRPYYGAGRGVAPPAGYTQTTPGSGAYTPPDTMVSRSVGDTRVGAINLGAGNVALPQQGDLVLAGQVDPTAGQMYITASPTAGIRTFGANEITGFTTNTQYNPVGTRLDPAAIQRMRDELNNEAGITNPGAQAPGNTLPNSLTPGATPTLGAIPAPGATKIEGASPIVQQPVVQPNLGPKAIDTAVNAAATPTAQSSQNRIVAIPSADKQSKVYAELLKRYQENLANPTLTDEQRQRDFNAVQQQAIADAKAGTTAKPGTSGAVAAIPPAPDAAQGSAAPGAAGQKGITGKDASPTAGTPGTAAGGVPDYAARGEKLLREGVPKEQQKQIIAKKAPIKVPSLSEGMKGKQLTEVMKSAEQLLRDGKFTAALDKYDDAERVVPNNPMVNLGRAHAELGASYYARAESHLRDLFSNHPELLVAQYDLTSMLGEQRLQTLVNDLKTILKKDQKEPRPAFLLSYIAYNTGREQEADAYLDLADKRSGGADPFYKLLRNNWSLPSKAGATPENK